MKQLAGDHHTEGVYKESLWKRQDIVLQDKIRVKVNNYVA